jgi:hypothetical protein
MTLPNLLLFELRLAFKTCAKQHTTRPHEIRSFSTLQPLFKKKHARSGSEIKPPSSVEITTKSNIPPSRKRPQADSLNVSTNELNGSRELVPDPSKPTSVSERKRADVPMKIIPKAQITPEVTLTPKERLEIEFMTRRPPRTEAKKSGLYTGSGDELYWLTLCSL